MEALWAASAVHIAAHTPMRLMDSATLAVVRSGLHSPLVDAVRVLERLPRMIEVVERECAVRMLVQMSLQ